MKPEIHPNYAEIKVVCSCGNEFTTRSTLGQDLHVEVCSSCHPFYHGQAEDRRQRRTCRQIPQALRQGRELTAFPVV